MIIDIAFLTKIFAIKSLNRRKTTNSRKFWSAEFLDEDPQSFTAVCKRDLSPTTLGSLIELKTGPK